MNKTKCEATEHHPINCSGKIIEAVRTSMGFTLEDLSREIRIKPVELARYEEKSGAFSLGDPVYDKIHDYLKVVKVNLNCILSAVDDILNLEEPSITYIGLKH